MALGLRLDKACKQAGRWEAAHHFFSNMVVAGIGLKQGPGHLYLCGVLWCTQWSCCLQVRAAGEARRNEEMAESVRYDGG
ncbi:MAG: hypothetical protein ACLTYN_13660 [Dysosmobacter welbionis]